MKKLNRKGFTLIELLAVIVVLAIVLVVTIPSVLNSMNNARTDQFKNAVATVEKYMEDQINACILGDAKLAKYDEDIFTKDENNKVTCRIDSAQGSNIAKKAGYKNGEFASITVTSEGKVAAATAGGKFSGAEDYSAPTAPTTSTTPQE